MLALILAGQKTGMSSWCRGRPGSVFGLFGSYLKSPAGVDQKNLIPRDLVSSEQVNDYYAPIGDF